MKKTIGIILIFGLLIGLFSYFLYSNNNSFFSEKEVRQEGIVPMKSLNLPEQSPVQVQVTSLSGTGTLPEGTY